MPAPSLRSGTIALALVLLLPMMGAAPFAAAEPSGISEKLTITSKSANPARSFEAFDANAVQLYDLDGDGALELIANNDNNRAFVLDGTTGRLLLEITTPHPRSWNARELNGIAIGNVNGNDIPDLVIANSASWVTAFEVHPPATPNGDWEARELWRTFIDPTDLDPNYLDNRTRLNATWDGYVGLDGAAFLADVDGDGKDEAFFQTDDAPGQYSLDDNGTVRWWSDWGDGNANPVVADVDKDGHHEAVFVTDGGRVMVYDARDGRAQCVFDAEAVNAEPGSISVAPQLVDVTGDGRLEIVFGARQAVKTQDEDWIEKQHATYVALDHRCDPVWAKRFTWGNPHVYMRAAPADVDGDGDNDLVFHDWNTIGHKPGNWEVTGDANLFAVDGATGELLWRTSTDTYWSNKDIAVADVRNGPEPEVLVVAQNAGQDGITLVDRQGRTLEFLSAGKGWLVSRGPSVGDVDGDGLLEIVFPVHREGDHCPPRDLDVGCRAGAIRVFDTSKTVPREDQAPLQWSGSYAFNTRVDFGDAAPRAHGADVGVEVAPDGPGVLALRTSDASHVFVKRPGVETWHALEDTGDGVWQAPLHPVNGEEWRVRVTVPGPRVGYTTMIWQGEGPGRLEGRVDGHDLFDRVHVVVAQGGTHVQNLTVDGTGAFRADLPPGTYALTPVSEGGETGETRNVTVRPAEVHEVGLVLEEESVATSITRSPGVLGAVGLAAVVGVAAVVHAHRRRDR